MSSPTVQEKLNLTMPTGTDKLVPTNIYDHIENIGNSLGYDFISYGADPTGVVDSSAILSSIIASIVAGGTNEIITFGTGTFKIDANISASSLVTFNFLPGAKLQIESGHTLIINGAIYGLTQIFSGSGSVDLSTNYIIEKVSVKWFGATGDGTIDDTVAVQLAINTAPAGSVIEFPAGTYLLSTQLTISKSLTLKGPGTIKLKANSALADSGNWYWIYVSGDDVKFDGLTFDGNGTNQTYACNALGIGALSIADGNRITITNCTIHNCKGTGICCGRSTDVIISNCFIHDIITGTNNSGEGVVFAGTNGASLISSIFGSVTDHHVYIARTSINITVSGCSFKSSLTQSIVVYGTANNATVTGNTFDDCGVSVLVTDYSTIVRTNGVFSSPITLTTQPSVASKLIFTWSAIRAHDGGTSKNMTITGTDVDDAVLVEVLAVAEGALTVTSVGNFKTVDAGGIVLEAGFDATDNLAITVLDMPQNVTISNNSIKLGHGVSATHGIQVAASVSASRLSVVNISGNTIYQLGLTDDITGHGIVIQRALGITIIGNNVSNNNGAGILLEGADSVNVIGNAVFNNCKKAGGAYPAGIYVCTLTYVPANIVISKNMIYDTLGDTQTNGIRIDDGNITVADNTMYGNVSSSIYVYEGANAINVIGGARVALTYSGTISLDPSLGNVFTTTTVHATGNSTINASSAGTAGQQITIIVTNDATSPKVITFGTNFTSLRTLTGTISTAKSVTFISNGSAWIEVFRSPADSGLVKELQPDAMSITGWADGANNVVTVFPDHDNTNHRDYIRLTSSTATQDYDLVLSYRIPNDFGVFHTSALTVDIRSSDKTYALATLSLYDVNGSVDAGINALALTAANNNTWETFTDTPTAAYTTGDYIHLHIHVTAGDGTPDTYDVSRLSLSYTKK